MARLFESTRCIVPYPGTTRAEKAIAVVDIETEGLGGKFVYGGWGYYRGNDAIVEFFSDMDEWISAFLSKKMRGYVWYAHNGGEYDYKYLVAALQERCGNSMLRLITQGSGGRVIGAVYKHARRRYELRDSWALAPVSLRELCATLGVETQKGYLDHEHETFDPSNPEHIAYLQSDILGLLQSVERLRTTTRSLFDVSLGWTAGATAMRGWRRTLAQGAIYWRAPERIEEFTRQAYYGGLVSLSSINREHDVYDFDVNAMYATAMRAGVPYGAPAWTEREVPGYPGIYECRCAVARNFSFTFLPYRQQASLSWPTGHFSSVLDSGSIAVARQLGIEIECGQGVVYNDIVYPFNDFLESCQQLELEGGARKVIAKLMRNSLYGKFGTRPETTAYCFWPENERGWAPHVAADTGQFFGLFERTEQVEAGYLQPVWAAWITAQARLILRKLVERAGYENCWYTDTDSLKVCSSVLSHLGSLVGKGYGALKLVGRYTWFQAGGPKNYVYLRHGESIPKSCLKGIPQRSLSPAAHLQALGGAATAVSFISTNATRRTLGEGVERATQRTRTIGTLASSSSWVHVGEGRVRPIHIKG